MGENNDSLGFVKQGGSTAISGDPFVLDERAAPSVSSLALDQRLFHYNRGRCERGYRLRPRQLYPPHRVFPSSPARDAYTSLASGAEGAAEEPLVRTGCKAVTLPGTAEQRSKRESARARGGIHYKIRPALDEATLKMEAMDTIASSHPRRMHNSYEDEEERKHFQRIVSAFRYYK